MADCGASFNGIAACGAEPPFEPSEADFSAALLREHYDAMKRYFAFQEGRAAGGVLADGLGDWYDITKEKTGRANLTPPPLTATAHHYLNALTLAKVAAVLGRPDDQRLFADKARTIGAHPALCTAIMRGRFEPIQPSASISSKAFQMPTIPVPPPVG